MNNDFDCIKRLPPYVFAEVNRLKADARHNGQDIIDFGMGNPDSPTPSHIIDKLIEVSKDPKTHGYSASKGIKGLRNALCNYYDYRFGVELDPDTEVVATMGSKEGLANLARAITSRGDTIIVPNPSYPIHAYGFILAGANISYIKRDYDVDITTDILKKLKDAVEQSTPKPKAIVLNYPSNPTAETVDLSFYEQIVDFCKHHQIYVISDIAYSEIYFEKKPPSILEVKGAKEVAIEFSSVSKSYSMAGWRVGFAAGNKELISALIKIKSYVDYGGFTPIQVAAAAALNGPQNCVENFREMYLSRRDVLVKNLHEAGWNVQKPEASMFVWAKIPEKYKHLGSLDFSIELLNKASVAVAPGIGFGSEGDNFVRIALVENEQRIKQACKNIKRFLED